MAKDKEEEIVEKDKEADSKGGQAQDEEQHDGENEDVVSKEEYQQLNDKYLRLFAEFENYKKRTIKERMELVRNAAQETIVSLLPVLDDFDRAKKNAEDEDTDEYFSEGVEIVYHKLYKVLQQKGLKAMETNGKEFDAELHEAVSEIPAPSDDMQGKIIDTVEKGYFLNDKIIRHAKVVVGK